ncbi:MAG: electron transporter RnfD [Ruminococcus sp.]|nr:electron transporter RnfD [Ruminococcus sp.]
MPEKFIPCNDSSLAYMGRIDDSKTESFRFIYAGSQVSIRFKGERIAAVLANTMQSGNEMSIGAVVDGRLVKCVFDNGWNNHDKQTVVIAKGLDKDSRHEVTMFKRQAAYHFFEFFGFEIGGFEGIEKYHKDYSLKLEVYGDSVSAGEVVEAVENTGANDPEGHNGKFDNAYYAYPMITARNLNAEIHNNAQGGIAIFDGTGYFHLPQAIGVETTWDKLSYYPEGPFSDWDFSRYTPDIVIMAVGQNDPHCEGEADRDISDPDYRRKWKDKYKEITRSLMGKYPKAQFVFLLTVLMHYPEWDKAVKEVTDELDVDRVHYLEFTRTGKATPGHPRIYEQYEMAEQLTAFITTKLLKGSI